MIAYLFLLSSLSLSSSAPRFPRVLSLDRREHYPIIASRIGLGSLTWGYADISTAQFYLDARLHQITHAQSHLHFQDSTRFAIDTSRRDLDDDSYRPCVSSGW